jgi:hypothetical protein
VTPVLMADCAGLWRRTLLVASDGTRDAGSGVQWLQGITAYVDSRGFGGWLHQRADVFEWSRFAELHASENPDAGRMRWDGDTLIEVGVHDDYIEHWRRDCPVTGACWALRLASADGDEALLLRVGDEFGWLRRGSRVEVSMGTIAGDAWRGDAREFQPKLISDELLVDEDGGEMRRWRVKDSEGTVSI